MEAQALLVDCLYMKNMHMILIDQGNEMINEKCFK